MEFKILTSYEPFFQTIKGKEIVYKGYTFMVPYKYEADAHFEFYYQGLGFNGDRKKNKDSIKAIEERMGEKKFWDSIKSTTPIEDAIKEKHQQVLNNIKKRALIKTLSRKLGFAIPTDGLIYVISGKVTVDITEFDEKFKRRYGDYEDNKTSLNAAIRKTFDKKTADEIDYLLK